MKNKKIYLVSLIIMILDQIIKYIINNNIMYEEEIIVIKNFFNITNIKNTGGAFSILNNNVFFLALTGIIIMYFIIKYIESNKNNNLIENLGLSFILGGLLGNLIDRLFNKGVVDYLSFKIFNYYFPVFNLADIFIVLGVFLVLITGIGSEISESRKNKNRQLSK